MVGKLDFELQAKRANRHARSARRAASATNHSATAPSPRGGAIAAALARPPAAVERVGVRGDRGFAAVDAHGNSGTAGMIGLSSRTRRFAKPRAGAQNRRS